MFNAMTSIGTKLRNDLLFVFSAALLLSALAYQNHNVFIIGAMILFAGKIHFDMSEAVMLEAKAIKSIEF